MGTSGREVGRQVWSGCHHAWQSPGAVSKESRDPWQGLVQRARRLVCCIEPMARWSLCATAILSLPRNPADPAT